MIETLSGLNAIFTRFEPFKRLNTVKLAKVEQKGIKCGICKRGCTKRRLKSQQK